MPHDMIQLFSTELQDLERIKKQSPLGSENSERLSEISSHFDGLNPDLARAIYDFFYEYFTMIEQVPYLLDAKSAIECFSSTLDKYYGLESLLRKELAADFTEFKDFFEDYKLMLENRLEAIQQEQKAIARLDEKSLDDRIYFLETTEGRKLVLDMQQVPEPLIGMNDLLNYQIMQIININQRVYDQIIHLAQINSITEIYVRSNIKPNEQEQFEFWQQIEEDKKNPGVLEEIAEEYSLNLLYRLAWDGILDIKVCD